VWKVLRGLFYGLLGIIVVLVVVVKLGVDEFERRSDPTPFVELLDSVPVPAQLHLLEDVAIDGHLFMGPSAPEVYRVYAAPGSVAETCREVDDFYQDLDIETRDGVPSDECERILDTEQGSVTVSVRPFGAFREIPPGMADQPELVEIRYQARR
jgi:hypothetical protein